MKVRSDFYIIPIIIILALILPVYSFIEAYVNPQRNGGHAFSFFILIVAIERLWETFYSSQERRRHRIHGDWTLPLVSIFYLALGFIKINEFFLINRKINISLVILSTMLYCYAFALRWLARKSLGKQWTVHAAGAQKIKRIRLLKTGPYKYIRHPIYAGVILELISFSLIFNTYYAFLFCLSFNVPLQIFRSYIEEKASARRFGRAYLEYKKEIPAFIPKMRGDS